LLSRIPLMRGPLLRILAAALIANISVLNAWPATAANTGVQTAATQAVAAAPGNQPVLPPGGAAGIKRAQGLENDRYWWQAGLIIGAFVVVFLLAGIDGDDDEATTTASH